MEIDEATMTFMKRLNDEGIWQRHIRSVGQKIPNIPSYNAADDNTEIWKYNSAMRQGFELCYKLLTLKSIGD